MPITTDAILDTNILLRTTYDGKASPTSAFLAYQELIRRGWTIGTTVANLAEFANVSTRTVSENGLGLSPHQAMQRIQLFESQLAVYSESIESYRIWKYIVTRYDVRGKQVHDARIAAIMLQSGIRNILTYNSNDFKRFPEIATLHPDQVLES
jgi:predicted nucleic acid-binding protein